LVYTMIKAPSVTRMRCNSVYNYKSYHNTTSELFLETEFYNATKNTELTLW